MPEDGGGTVDDDTGRWRPANLTRSEKLGSEDVCSYKLLTEHFSKFAVGGVVPTRAAGAFLSKMVSHILRFYW